MTVEEVFAKINSHEIEGIMLHDQLAEYFDFLNLHGYKRMHEYRALCEFAEHRGIVRYYINHYNRLLPETAAANPAAIPVNWRGYSRQQVDASTKRKAIREAFVKWREWETETKKLYESSYCELCEIGEVAAACKVKSLVADVDEELKNVDRKYMKLESIDYDLPTIYLCQDEIHEQYAEKTKHIGVDIC